MDQKPVFDEVNRIFTLRGKVLLSVTDILVLSGIVDPTFFTEISRIRGTAVHQAVFLDIFGDLHVPGLHPMVRPYIEAWFLFKARTRFRPILSLCEKRFYHPLYGYVGRPDLVGWLNGRPALIDIKSGGAGAAKYQLAAYREFPAIIGYQPDRFSLSLKADGSYRLDPYSNPNDWLVFYDALTRVKKDREALT